MKIRTRKADLSPEMRMRLNREWRQLKRDRRAFRHLVGALHGGKAIVHRRTGQIIVISGPDANTQYPRVN